MGKAISFLPLSLLILHNGNRVPAPDAPSGLCQSDGVGLECVCGRSSPWDEGGGGQPGRGRGVRGWEGSSRHLPPHLYPGGPGGAMLPIFSSLPGVLFFRSSPEAVRGRPCFAGSVGPPGGSQGYFVSPLAAGPSLGFPLFWRGIPVLGKQWLRLLPQPIAFCVQEGKAPRKSVFPKE